MKKIAVAAATVLALCTGPAHADRPGDVERARANARAGGPTNERDRELLERYGTLSGTPTVETRRKARHRARIDRRDDR